MKTNLVCIGCYRALRRAGDDLTIADCIALARGCALFAGVHLEPRARREGTS